MGWKISQRSSYWETPYHNEGTWGRSRLGRHVKKNTHQIPSEDSNRVEIRVLWSGSVLYQLLDLDP